MNYEQRKSIKRIAIVLLCIAVIGLLCVPLFFYFRLNTEGRLALREAKNVKLALTMVDIEYYGRGKCVYDGTRVNGMADGVMEKIQSIMENDSNITLISYSKKNHEVTGFIYSNQHFQVTYHKDELLGEKWNVAYLLPALVYGEGTEQE